MEEVEEVEEEEEKDDGGGGGDAHDGDDDNGGGVGLGLDGGDDITRAESTATGFVTAWTARTACLRRPA